MNQSIICLFNFDLLYDFNNLVLAVIKHTFPHLDILQLIIQRNPFLYMIDDQVHDQAIQMQQMLKINLITIKPQIGALETLEFLNLHSVDYDVYTNLPKDFDQLVKDSLHLPEKKIYSSNQNIIIFDNTFKESTDTQKFMIKNYSFKDKTYWDSLPHLEDLTDIDWQKILGIQDKPNFSQSGYKVTLKDPSLDLSIRSWSNYLTLTPIRIRSKVVKGFGRGGKELGIPTANLEVTQQIQISIENLLPGVYVGMVELQGKKYGGVMSIGFNPYYQNSQKTVEVYVFSEFENDFYSHIIAIEILYFLRAESDFKQFSYLVKYINNDVFTARQLVNQVVQCDKKQSFQE